MLRTSIVIAAEACEKAATCAAAPDDEWSGRRDLLLGDLQLLADGSHDPVAISD